MILLKIMNITKINSLKKEILNVAYTAGEGHIASSFSILDILWVIFDKLLKKNEYNNFILSKGHGCLALYAMLYEKKLIHKKDFYSFCSLGSNLGGHPDKNKLKYITASTGSLGHGLPISVGIALAEKINKTNKKIFCLIGDGETNEGTIWESFLLASNHKLNNLVCIMDHNHSNDRALNLGDMKSKLLAFGWIFSEINGHSHDDIFKIMSKKTNFPHFILANTIKGYGIKDMENNPAWHHRVPNDLELKMMIKELD